MGKTTEKSVEERKKERLKKNNKSGLIRRNTWGIEKPLESRNYSIPTGPAVDVVTGMDIALPVINQAVSKIKRINKLADELSRNLKALTSEQIILVCKEAGISSDASEILSKKDISDKFKWEIIFGMDKVINEK